MEQANPRSRRFCFTLNNYHKPGAGWDEGRVALAQQGLEYAVYGFEEAPGTGTPHVQGYVFFEKKILFSRVCKLVPKAHWEVAHGNHKQNRDYCTKGGSYQETGKLPEDDPGKQGAEYWKLKKAQIIDRSIEEADTKYFLQNFQTVRAIQREHPRVPPAVSHETKVGIWVWGASGVGKSRGVRQLFPNVYLKNLNKWWDGYDLSTSPPVLLEDVDPSSNRDNWLDRYLKIWMDIYPFLAEVKGGGMMIRPPQIFVTSQYPPDTVFKEPETLEALTRRMRVVHLTSFACWSTFTVTTVGPTSGQEDGAPDATVEDGDGDAESVAGPSSDVFWDEYQGY